MQTHTFKNSFTTKFEYIKANSPKTHKFTILYLHGLCSDPWGLKPESIKSFCQQQNIGFFRFEMAGHGSDKHNYENTDINIWKEQLLEIIDDIIDEPILLIGTSMGGWLSLLGAMARPNRVCGVIGISAAPDFTIGLENEYLSPEQKLELKQKGKIQFKVKDFTYTFTSKLINSGKKNQILNKEIDIHCPVHLIQGIKDMAYPWKYSLQILQQIQGENVMLKLRKNAGHRMQEPDDIAEIINSIKYFSDIDK